MRLLIWRRVWVQRRQGKRVVEMMGRLDRRCPRRVKHRLRRARGIQSVGMPAIHEGEDLLHDPMEDDAATE